MSPMIQKIDTNHKIVIGLNFDTLRKQDRENENEVIGKTSIFVTKQPNVQGYYYARYTDKKP